MPEMRQQEEQVNMPHIRTWRERCQDFDAGHITTDMDIRLMMQQEIDELRAWIEMLERGLRAPRPTTAARL